MNRSKSKLIVVLAAPFVAAACASKVQSPSATSAVEIAFSLNLGGTPVSCGTTYRDVGSASAEISLQDARVYVSNFRLLTADGRESPLELEQDGVWQHEGLALLDFEDATGACNGNPVTNTTVRAAAPAVPYVGLAFDVGVPESMNHQDPTLAAAPLNLSALTWPWRNGYKYTTIDLETSITSGAVEGAPGFSVHIGAMECGDGSPVRPPAVTCQEQNRPSVRLNRFDASEHIVIIDLAALLAETDLTTNAPDTPSGCMSAADDADCDGIFRRAGLRGIPQDFVRAEQQLYRARAN